MMPRLHADNQHSQSQRCTGTDRKACQAAARLRQALRSRRLDRKSQARPVFGNPSSASVRSSKRSSMRRHDHAVRRRLPLNCCIDDCSGMNENVSVGSAPIDSPQPTAGKPAIACTLWSHIHGGNREAREAMADQIVILPGITGSVLKKNGKVVWGCSFISIAKALLTQGKDQRGWRGRRSADRDC